MFALLFLTLFPFASAADSVSSPEPAADAVFTTWLATPSVRHATVAAEVMRVDTADALPVFSHNAEVTVTPASVLKLVTTATALRVLGPEWVWPHTAQVVDSTLEVPAGLEGYCPDWMIEDIGQSYMPPLSNRQADGGRRLAAVVSDINHQSLNQQAETLLHLLTPSCRHDSALLLVRQLWTAEGLDMDGVLMRDGNGAAAQDGVTAHFVVSLLSRMAHDAAFVRSLPLVGREGTVRNFLKGTRHEGTTRLKSGTMKDVVSYAGYATGRDGHRYAVAIFVNHHALTAREMRLQLEPVIDALIP